MEKVLKQRFQKYQKPKKAQLGKLKKKLWKIFSEFVRLSESDLDGNSQCVTCGLRVHWKALQAGHFISGRNNGVLFDERNVHSQCAVCNIWKHGNLEEYYPYMLKKYGQGIIDSIKENKRNPPKLTVGWYEKSIEYYEDLVCKLKFEKKVF